jgi:hypothetical protein
LAGFAKILLAKYLYINIFIIPKTLKSANQVLMIQISLLLKLAISASMLHAMENDESCQI